IAFERRLPGDFITQIAYVGTRTDGGYADLNINYGTPGPADTANQRRQYFAMAGTTAINDWAARTKSRYHSLQVSLNRPIRNGLMVMGSYTLSRAKDMADEDGWVGLTWNSPLMYGANYALAGFDRTNIFQMGVVYDLPFLKTAHSKPLKLLSGWQTNGIFAAYSGTPYSIGGSNNALNCADCGSILINVSGDPKPIGAVGSSQPYYDPSLFSQPTGTGVEGFGNSGRNTFRRPSVWNLDFSLFKQFSIGERIKPEFRVEAANLFNHTNWGAPVTDINSPNFLQFIPSSTDITTNGTNAPGARRIQFGFRVTF
ncbi:MAG: hypothetical protein J2P31_13330, partial [Blastocatellia bacterium]|nr:hypothetical protein [Blastocatellia bacterium]